MQEINCDKQPKQLKVVEISLPTLTDPRHMIKKETKTLNVPF